MQQTNASQRGGPDAADLERARVFVASIRWQYARTVPEHPHSYSLPEWAPEPDERTWFIETLTRYGHKGVFWGSQWVYLELGDGFRYWSSQCWHGGEPTDVMLNRCRVDDGQLRLEVER